MLLSRLRGLFAAPAIIGALLLAAPATADPLENFPGGKRVLLMFVSDEGNETLARQADQLEPYGTALERKELVPVVVVSDQRVITLTGEEALPPEAAPALRERYGVPSEAAFAGILVDETGETIWQGDIPVAMSEIITLLPDPMPDVKVVPELEPQVGPSVNTTGETPAGGEPQ